MNFVCGNATNTFHAKLIIRSKATKTWAQQIQDNDSMQFCFIAWSPSTMLLKKKHSISVPNSHCGQTTKFGNILW